MPPELVRFYEDVGVVAAGARPLEFRGELMGVIGMISRRPFDPQEFELLGIFADQAAVAIKSAHLFTKLQRYKERLQVENAYLQIVRGVFLKGVGVAQLWPQYLTLMAMSVGTLVMATKRFRRVIA